MIVQNKTLKYNILIFIALLGIFSIYSDNLEMVTVSTVPQSVEDFLAIRDSIATTPEGGVAVFLLAMMKYGENEELGLKFLTIAFDQQNLTAGDTYKGFKIHNSWDYHLGRLKKKPYWAFAYIEGAKPENGYKTSLPYKFQFVRNRFSVIEKDQKIKTFVKCYGVSPRPVTMVKNNKDLWKVFEVSSLFVDVTPPVVNKNDDL